MATKISKVYARNGEAGSWVSIDKLYIGNTLFFQESPTSSVTNYNYTQINLTMAPSGVSGYSYIKNNYSESLIITWSNGVETNLQPGQPFLVSNVVHPVYVRKNGYPNADVTGDGAFTFYATIAVSTTTNYGYTRNLYVN